MNNKVAFAIFLLFSSMIFQNCKKDEEKKMENPFSCSFVTPPDYSGYPYFVLTNISKSNIKNIVINCEAVMTYPNVPSFTIASLAQNSSVTIGINEGIYWIIGDKVTVKLDNTVITYFYNY